MSIPVIAIDAMGGDYGPEPIIEGLIQALDEKPFKAILVGDRDKILSFLPEYYLDSVDIVNCNDVIAMSEAATDARSRKESSIYQAVELVRDSKANALVSAGHSGATMALSVLRIGRIKGVNKPPLATLMPNSSKSKTLLLDVGAVVECKPNNLYEFAILGKVYAKEILGISKPRIGILSNGEEDSKGNDLTKEAFVMLKEVVGFVGNIEGRDIFNGSVDVVVTDGFTGNIVLKTSEGVVSTILSLMKQNIKKSIPAKIGALMMKKKVFSKLKKEIDYAEYGGAPLLGIKGCSIISHGSSNAKAIKNAIFQAIAFSKADMSDKFEKAISEY